MANVHVAYSITVKTVDGKELTFENERILYELDTVKPQNIEDCLKRNFQETDRIAIQHQFGKEITSLAFKVTKVTELKSAGDDDQM